jgi:calcineurin-like phosphoesterase family protein
MEENIVELWNHTVGKKDTVFHLGDFGWGTRHYKVAERLNGFKRLIMGNHDNGNLPHIIKYFNSVHGILKKGEFVFTHVPIIMDKYHMWEYNVHGHIHHKDQNVPDWRYYNANMDVLKYYGPIALDEIRQEMNKRKLEQMMGEFTV